MHHHILTTHIRNCLNERFLGLLIGSIPLHLLNSSFTKRNRYAKFCTFPPNPTRLSDLELLVNKIHVGCGEDEIMNSLMHDESCGAINVSHTLVDSLLHRFKDDWKSALGVFRWAESNPHFEHLPEAYDLMVDILGKTRQFSNMRKLVNEMRDKKLVTLKTISKMMRRFAGARQWKDAVRTFDELESFKLEKNVDSMNVLLDALCKENKVEMAREIFLELKLHITPTPHTFNIFIHGWCKINRVEEAYWTLQEMKGHGFHACEISYSTIIQFYCQQCNWSMIYDILDVMEAQGCKPSVVTYTAIMCSLAKANELEDALKIAGKVKSAGYKPDTMFYNALIHTLGKAGRLTEAIDVFEMEMPNNGILPNTSTYNTLIAMFCHHGLEQRAFNTLEVIEKSGICKPDLQTFSPLLKACFKLGAIDSCLRKLLHDMTIKHHLSLDVSTYTLLIHGLVRVDKCEWAFHFFEEMIGKELIPRYQTCRFLLDEVKQRSMYDAAEKVDLYIKNLKSSQQWPFPGSRARIVSSAE